MELFIMTNVDNETLSDCSVTVREFKDFEDAKESLRDEIDKEYINQFHELEDRDITWIPPHKNSLGGTNGIGMWSIDFGGGDGIAYGIQPYECGKCIGILFNMNVCHAEPIYSWNEWDNILNEAQSDKEKTLDNKQVEWDKVVEGEASFDYYSEIGECTHRFIPHYKFNINISCLHKDCKNKIVYNSIHDCEDWSDEDGEGYNKEDRYVVVSCEHNHHELSVPLDAKNTIIPHLNWGGMELLKEYDVRISLHYYDTIRARNKKEALVFAEDLDGSEGVLDGSDREIL